jgi:hypothetical protein
MPLAVVMFFVAPTQRGRAGIEIRRRVKRNSVAATTLTGTRAHRVLGLSPRTVDKHLEQIYAKLGIENRTAAAAIAASASRRNS